jgi:hypothetical protein
MIRLRRTEGIWVQDVESTELRPIFRDDLVAALPAAGLEAVTVYGGYEATAFDAQECGDLIVVARRAD